MGMDFQSSGQKTSVKNGIFWIWNKVRIWRTEQHAPHQEFPGVTAGFKVF